MPRKLHLTLNVWRQSEAGGEGKLVTYDVPDINEDMSFLEMLDILNDRLLAQGEEPIAFEHDCREGICGSCGVMINGQAHGSQRGHAPGPTARPTARSGAPPRVSCTCASSTTAT